MLPFFVGKWNEENCIKFWQKVSKKFLLPTAKYRFNVCTDGNKQNIQAFKKIFPSGAVNYAKVKKIRIGDIVIGTVRKKELGIIQFDDIGIRHIDGFCARIRERVSRFCRRSKTFSKKKTPFFNHLQIFQVYNNFIDVYEDKKTPCMIEGITTKKFTWSDIFMTFGLSSQ